jgi:hypothetical protein
MAAAAASCSWTSPGAGVAKVLSLWAAVEMRQSFFLGKRCEEDVCGGGEISRTGKTHETRRGEQRKQRHSMDAYERVGSNFFIKFVSL